MLFRSASELLEVAVGAGGLSPAKDASGSTRHLVALRSLSREVVVRGLGSVGLRVLLVVVIVLDFWFPMFISMDYPNTTKQKMSTGLLSTSVERTDGKFDLFHQGSGFAEAGLWSIGIPQKPSWCNTICIKCGVRLGGPRTYSGVWAASSASLPP